MSQPVLSAYLCTTDQVANQPSPAFLSGPQTYLTSCRCCPAMHGGIHIPDQKILHEDYAWTVSIGVTENEPHRSSRQRCYNKVWIMHWCHKSPESPPFRDGSHVLVIEAAFDGMFGWAQSSSDKLTAWLRLGINTNFIIPILTASFRWSCDWKKPVRTLYATLLRLGKWIYWKHRRQMLVFLIQINHITLILFPSCDASLLLCDFLLVAEFCSALVFWFHMKGGANLPI